MEHILSLSYGKDSLACLGAIEELGWPLDRIVHAEVWATDTIPADLPPMVEFKKKADQVIKERWGIEVEHIKGNNTFESCFYFKRGRTGRKTKFDGKIYGWPMQRGQWCLQQLKRPSFYTLKNAIQYVGIAADEQERFHNLTETKKSPLVAVGWNERRCRQWCEENGLLSPIYKTSTRGGVLVLSQSKHWAASDFKKKLSGVMEIDAEMGRGQPSNLLCRRENRA